MTDPGRKLMFSVSRENPNVTVRPVFASMLATWMLSGRVPTRLWPVSAPSSRML